MHKYSLILLSVALISFTAHADKRPLTVLYEEYAPFYITSVNENKKHVPTGIYGDKIQKLFKGLNLTITWHEMPYNRVFQTLKHSKVPTCSFGFGKTAERRKLYKYTSVFSYSSPPIFVLRASSIPSGKSISSTKVMENTVLKGGFIKGVPYLSHLRPFLQRKENPHHMFVGKEKGLFSMLLAKRVDYIAMTMRAANHYLKKFNVEKDFHIIQLAEIKGYDLALYGICNQSTPDQWINLINGKLLKSLPH